MTITPNVIRLHVDPLRYSSMMEEQVVFECLHRIDGLLAFDGYDGLFYKPAVDNSALRFLMAIAKKWNLPMPQFQVFDHGPRGTYLRLRGQPWLKKMFPNENPIRTVRKLEFDSYPPGWEYLEDLEWDVPCARDGFTGQSQLVRTPSAAGYVNTNGDFWTGGLSLRMYGGNHWSVYEGGPDAKKYYNQYREPFPLPWMRDDTDIIDTKWERVMFSSTLDEHAFFYTLHRIDGIIGLYGEGPNLHILRHRKYFTEISDHHFQAVARRYHVAT